MKIDDNIIFKQNIRWMKENHVINKMNRESLSLNNELISIKKFEHEVKKNVYNHALYMILHYIKEYYNMASFINNRGHKMYVYVLNFVNIMEKFDTFQAHKTQAIMMMNFFNKYKTKISNILTRFNTSSISSLTFQIMNIKNNTQVIYPELIVNNTFERTKHHFDEEDYNIYNEILLLYFSM